jgi:hypothetical protein
MTFNIGDKVRVNDNYGAEYEEADESITLVRGSEGVVNGFAGNFVSVKQTKTAFEHWKGDRYLFWSDELDLLEEAHPLTKESINS